MTLWRDFARVNLDDMALVLTDESLIPQVQEWANTYAKGFVSVIRVDGAEQAMWQMRAGYELDGHGNMRLVEIRIERQEAPGV